MDSDFHYYGTGTAALAAGFSDDDATLIANVAQYVDWFDSDYWSYWRMVDNNGRPVNNAGGKQYRYQYPQLSVQKIDWKMSFDYNPNIWNTFHFLPGNLPYSGGNSGWRKAFSDNHVVRQTKLSRTDANKLCRPYSKFALDMVEDTIAIYNRLCTASQQELDSVISALVTPRVRCPVTDGRKLALHLLGLRMHVLADTWAHQDFSGEQNQGINGAGIFNYVYAKDDKGQYKKTTWTGTLWVLGEDTDCAAAPSPMIMEGLDQSPDLVCAGHGQMGHFPDYSWQQFKYPAAWLPRGTDSLERNNPEQYDQAWRWLSFLMAVVKGDKGDNDLPANTPDEINTVMSTWHPLSTSKLQAIGESEALWKKTSLGKKLPDRWDPAGREALGLYDGLAKTRFGYINVKQNSTLHCMETAAAIHYQFCVDWLKKNPDYSWVPWKPKS